MGRQAMAFGYCYFVHRHFQGVSSFLGEAIESMFLRSNTLSRRFAYLAVRSIGFIYRSLA